MGSDRYFIGYDNASHEYIVHLDCLSDWEKWLELDDEDEDSWEVPENINAVRVDGGLVTFSNPEVR